MASPFIVAFNTLDGLKTSTRRCMIGTSTPVFGLRPMRSPLSRTRHEPNEDSLTVSPVADPLVDRFGEIDAGDGLRDRRCLEPRGNVQPERRRRRCRIRSSHKRAP